MLVTAATLIAGAAYAADWYPYDAAKIEPPFAADGKSVDVTYVPLDKATKPWNICVSFPHMKDAYWLGVDWCRGGGQAARRQDEPVRGRRYAGSTKNFADRGLRRRKRQRCHHRRDFADGLNNLVSEIRKKDIGDRRHQRYRRRMSAKSQCLSTRWVRKPVLISPRSIRQALKRSKWAGSPGGGRGWVECGEPGLPRRRQGPAVKCWSQSSATPVGVQLKLVETAAGQSNIATLPVPR